MDVKPTDTTRMAEEFLSRFAKLEPSAARRQKGTAKSAKPKLARKAKGRDRRERTLVEEDGLYFQIRHPIGQASSHTRRRQADERTQKGAAAFRRAFQTVWGRLTESDRYALLHYWRGTGDDGLPIYPAPTTHARPLIQVASSVPPSDGTPLCAKLGAEFTFPLSLAAERTDRLRLEIARALAVGWRYATRRHWRLILERIEEPLAAWEAARERVTDGGRERKAKSLEQKYVRDYQADLEAVLRRWGFADAAATKRENEKK